MEIWCNEAQERYVLALQPEKFDLFQSFCERENAPFAVVGTALTDDLLKVSDPLHENAPIDILQQVCMNLERQYYMWLHQTRQP